MNFDRIVLFIANFGYQFVLALFLIKLVLLLWYKKGNVKFALGNFFYIRSSVSDSSREISRKEWPFFRSSYILISVVKYVAFLIWLIVFIMVQSD